MAVGDLIRSAESGGDPNAKNPNSSASGPDQFLDSTWLSTIKAARPDLAAGQSDESLLSLKTNPDISGQMRDYYAAQNQALLAKNGLPVTGGTTYLAHFAGPQGAVSVLKSDPNAPVSDILGPAVIRANPFLQGMSASDLRAWADRKMGGTTASSIPRPAQQPAQGILNQGSQSSAQPGVLNAPQDDTSVVDAFRNQLAALAQPHQVPAVAPLQPIQMAMPRGLSRARLLAALNQPVGT